MCSVPVYDIRTFSGDIATVRNDVIGQFAAYTANATDAVANQSAFFNCTNK